MAATLRPKAYCIMAGMAVSMLTAILTFGACTTTPKPKVSPVPRGLLTKTWAVPGWRVGHLALVDSHIFATDMNTIHALHRQGGIWFSTQIDRDERNQNTWLTNTRGSFALLHGRQSLGLYDMRKRQVIYRLPCPITPCGLSQIISTTPMVIQTQTTSSASTATTWHILQDRPWQVAWQWGVQSKLAPDAHVIDQRLVIVTQKTIRTLDLKSGKTLTQHNIPWPTPPKDKIKWAMHKHRGLFVSTSTSTTSQVVLMDLNDGRILKKTTINEPIQHVMATPHGWLFGGESSVFLKSWSLSKTHWQHRPAWLGLNWSTAQTNASHLIGRKKHHKTVWVIVLKSGLVDWHIETQSTAQTLAIDAHSNVVTNLKEGTIGQWRTPLR